MRDSNDSHLRRLALAFALLLGIASCLPAAADHEADGSYGYLRVLDGPASLVQSGTGTRSEAVTNQPLLAGDQLYLPDGTRAEAILSDGNLLRLDGATEVDLVALAGSPDTPGGSTHLRLLEGTLQIVVIEEALGEELPRIETANATLYVQEPGSFVVTADRRGFSEVTVREGAAEVVTRRGSLIVRDGERALVEGEDGSRSSVELAGGWTGFERWASRLGEEAAQADLDYVDDSLRYQASSLAEHGRWVHVDERPAWRPSVHAGWRPYSDGYWYTTPRGLSWVSYEPWGHVPYHYGSWDYDPRWGWVWFPGRVWAPAWVYWYWSPSYVGWCPVGYYTNHYYRHYRRGFHSGVYGWAGGDWGAFAEWNFLPTHRLRHRDQARYVRPSYALRRELGDQAMPRGLITTDTQGITPAVLEKPEESVRVLATRPARLGRGGELPDVKPFVARGELPPEVERQVVEDKPAPGRVVATPLRPVPPGEEAKPELARRPLRVAGRPDAETGGEAGKPEAEGRPARVMEVEPGGAPTSGGAAERPRLTRPSAPARPAGPQPSAEAGAEAGKPEVERPATVHRPPAGGGDEGPRAVRRPSPSVGSPSAGGGDKPAAERPERPRTVEPAEGGGREVRPARPEPPAARPDPPAEKPAPEAAPPRRARPRGDEPRTEEDKPPTSSSGSGEVRIERRPASATPWRPAPRTTVEPGRGASEAAPSRRPTYRPSPPAPAPAQRPPASTYRAPAPTQRPAALSYRAPAPTQRPAAPTYRAPAPTRRPAAPTYRAPAPTHRPPAAVQPPAAPRHTPRAAAPPAVERRPAAAPSRPAVEPRGAPSRPPAARSGGAAVQRPGAAASRGGSGGSGRGSSARLARPPREDKEDG